MKNIESTMTLLRHSNEGDEAARSELFGRYLPRMVRWARGRLPLRARSFLDTQDLVQDVAFKVLRKGMFDPEHSGAFGAYLRQGVVNRIRDELKRVARQPLREGTVGELLDAKPAPDEAAMGREMLARYEAALERLGDQARENVIYKLELGFSYREIAEILDRASADAVRMSVVRSLVKVSRDMTS